MFTFQRLDVYRCSLEFLSLCPSLLDAAPRGNGALADQLRRAAMSIPLNIAEAEGRIGDADKARIYSIARGSAMECAAILEALMTLKVVDEPVCRKGMELLERVVSMLTRMCRAHRE